MRIEGPLRTTASTVATFAVFTFNRYRIDREQWFCASAHWPSEPPTTRITIHIYMCLPPVDTPPNPGFLIRPAILTLNNTLPGRCHFLLDCRDGHWPDLQPWWDRFVDGLEQEEWVIPSDPPIDNSGPRLDLDPLPPFVPKRKRTREKYREKYRIAQPMVLAGKERWLIADALGVGDRTLSEILKFGDWEAEHGNIDS